jgi:hypothetical protein
MILIGIICLNNVVEYYSSDEHQYVTRRFNSVLVLRKSMFIFSLKKINDIVDKLVKDNSA